MPKLQVVNSSKGKVLETKSLQAIPEGTVFSGTVHTMRGYLPIAGFFLKVYGHVVQLEGGNFMIHGAGANSGHVTNYREHAATLEITDYVTDGA